MKKDACKVDCLKTSRDLLIQASVWIDRAANKAAQNNDNDCREIVQVRKALHAIIESITARYPIKTLDKSIRTWTEAM